MRAPPVSIVGSGHTPFGRLDALTLEDLIVRAAQEAMDEAGTAPSEIDAMFLGNFNSGLVDDGFASSLIQQASPELRFKPATRCENACASGSAAIEAGMHAIMAGSADTVLVVGAEKMTHRTTPEVTRALTGAGYQHNDTEKRMSFPQLFALFAQAYAERYQDPLPTMAAIAAKNHTNGLRNPLAHMRRELSFEDCNTVSERNPLIAPPLRLTDCSLVTDGAAALVLTRRDLASKFDKEVRFRSFVHVNDLMPLANRDYLAFEGAYKAIGMAYEEAGVRVADLDLAEVHDCFTIAELLVYEAMGLAPAGHGRDVIDDGTVMRGGALPVNLSGGLKSKGHPVGATGVSQHALLYRQLTQQAGDIQAEGDPELALVFNMGGAVVANYASIMEAKRV